jgi:hypothetical protein
MISTLYRNIARTHQQHGYIHDPSHLFGHAAERELDDAGSSWVAMAMRSTCAALTKLAIFSVGSPNRSISIDDTYRSR